MCDILMSSLMSAQIFFCLHSLQGGALSWAAGRVWMPVLEVPGRGDLFALFVVGRCVTGGLWCSCQVMHVTEQCDRI